MTPQPTTTHRNIHANVNVNASADEQAPNYHLSHYIAERLHLPPQAQHAWHRLFAQLMQQLENGHTLLKINADTQTLIADLPPHILITPEQAKAEQVAPLVADEQHLWLHRIWAEEHFIAKWIRTRLHASTKAINQQSIKPYLENLKSAQKQAILHALANPLTIINGGPGTGKTYTIARLVQAILDIQPDAHIQLTAPTGKAANRMETTLQQSLTNDIIHRLPPAKTIHRLLGIAPNRGARHHQHAPLDIDILIVDEASMLSLALMQQLVQALPAQAQLILLGDAHQLAAVEPGAVLHDMTQTQSIAPAVVTLTESTRFDQKSTIGQLALGVLNGDQDKVFTILEQAHIPWHTGTLHNAEQAQALYDQLFQGYQDYLDALQQLEQTTTALTPAHINRLLTLFDRYRILCAGHAGHLGTATINSMMRQRHLQQLNLPDSDGFYHGQPLMILTNDPQLQLFNGDIGLCLIDNHDPSQAHDNQSNQAKLYFPNHEEPITASRISLKNVTDAYALSIHKSQGSEFDHVAVCIDPAQNRLMSRELLYTAITRAKQNVDFYGKRTLIADAIHTPISVAILPKIHATEK